MQAVVSIIEAMKYDEKFDFFDNNGQYFVLSHKKE